MLLRSKANRTGNRSTRHFNLPTPDGRHGEPHPDGKRHNYTIGAEPVEIPDPDARIILNMAGHQVEVA